MKILHTSDWHLGHRLYDRDRTDEHRAALAWLLDMIETEKVAVLIVAGDVFDTMNPSNTARNLYYNFLGELQRTSCQAAIIVGGNHDSPSLLDAPAELLSHLNLHVIGGTKNNLADQVIELNINQGAAAGAVKVDLLVAAVPYLREKDLKYSIAGESPEGRKQRLRTAILQHYQDIAAAVAEKRKDPQTPVVATGHLFAAGSVDASDKQTHIYLADKNNIEAGQFPDIFDYVALGHIHQAQRVGGHEHVRYSGSLVPLTFGEARQPQSVYVFDLSAAGEPVTVKRLTVPRFRDLLSVRGTAEEVFAELEAFHLKDRTTREEGTLAPWLEVRVETPHPLPLLREELTAILEKKNPALAKDGSSFAAQEAAILRTSLIRPEGAENDQATLTSQSLSELDPEEVFHRLCHGTATGERQDYSDLLASFRELRTWMEEETTEA